MSRRYISVNDMDQEERITRMMLICFSSRVGKEDPCAWCDGARTEAGDRTISRSLRTPVHRECWINLIAEIHSKSAVMPESERAA